MGGFNLPPGCNVSDIPGNGPEDEKWEAIIEGFWNKEDRTEEQQKALADPPQVYVDLIDAAVEYGVEIGRAEERQAIEGKLFKAELDTDLYCQC